VRRSSSDEEHWFLTLMAGAGPALLGYFERRVGAEGADLLAETIEIAWRRRQRLPREAEPARMWLFGVARNVLRSAYRAGISRQHIADALRAQTELTAATDPVDPMSIRDLVARLDDPLAEVVTLVHWEGFSLAEIGLILGVPASNCPRPLPASVAPAPRVGGAHTVGARMNLRFGRNELPGAPSAHDVSDCTSRRFLLRSVSGALLRKIRSRSSANPVVSGDLPGGLRWGWWDGGWTSSRPLPLPKVNGRCGSTDACRTVRLQSHWLTDGASTSGDAADQQLVSAPQ
jgi:DNA-directed RNA polymerase specialized sigma24 family protein